LIEAELDGYPSHGVLRVPEYVSEVHAGAIDPQAQPAVSRLGPQALRVDGHRAFGALSAATLARVLRETVEAGELTCAALVASGHVGRLASVARPVAEAGGVLIGFCNLLGAGQRVIPWGGSDGRLCTNPLVIALPCRDPGPVILDMTTSTVSEGRIRTALQRGERLPAGWLVDTEGAPCDEPSALYERPPRAFLAPLGGAKGFGLGLLVELLAGVITGAGTVTATRRVPGNGGLFVAFRSTLLGGDEVQLSAEVQAVAEHVVASAPQRVRIPGWRKSSQREWIELPDPLWTEICTVGES
jgi:LDH2 family malate/lactate/ureidoglycolate dehydrogenase